MDPISRATVFCTLRGITVAPLSFAGKLPAEILTILLLCSAGQPIYSATYPIYKTRAG